MNKMSNYLCCIGVGGLIFTITSLSSCGKSNQEISEPETLTIDKTELSLVIPYDSLQSPTAMIIEKDNLIIANSGTDIVLDKYTLDGRHIDSFLQKGSGPKEVKNVSMLQYAAFNNSLYINEEPFLPLKKMINISSNHPEIESQIKLEYTDSAVVHPNGEKIVLKNGNIIVKNCAIEGMLAEFDSKHRFIRLIQPYPPKSEFGEGMPDYAIFNFYIPRMGVSPNGLSFVTAYAVGDIIAFGKVVNDTVAVDFKIKSVPAGVKIISQGENSFGFEFDDEWKNTYGSPTLSNKYAYVPWYGVNISPYMIYGGAPEGYEQTIFKYDLDGHLKQIIKIPNIVVNTIAVTEDDSKLFMLTNEADTGYEILCLQLE